MKKEREQEKKHGPKRWISNNYSRSQEKINKHFDRSREANMIERDDF